jgi:hypothetical protein
MALFAAQRACLGRLGQMRHDSRSVERLIDEQPPRARLHRHLHVLAGKLRHPLADRLAVTADAATHDLARLGIERVEGDLRPVHIQASEDRHQGPPL